jgi:predicted RecB family nuclease
VDGPSKLGDYHYVPMLFHGGGAIRAGQRRLLELYGMLLSRMQGRTPGSGIVWYGRECIATKVRLSPDPRTAERLLRKVERARDGGPPRLILNDHCQVCEFRERCHAEARSRDDLSLLRGMSEREVAKWGQRGICTVTQLACTFRARKRNPRPGQSRPPHQHALQAKAVTDRKIYVLGTPDLPAGPSRIYLDLEGDPERGFVYLIGLLVEANGTEERCSYWADTPAEETALFRQLLDVVDRHPDAQRLQPGRPWHVASPSDWRVKGTSSDRRRLRGVFGWRP